jgi:hypothetical protein
MGPEGRARIGAESRAYVERVHDIERVTDALLDLYAAIGRGRRETGDSAQSRDGS